MNYGRRSIRSWALRTSSGILWWAAPDSKSARYVNNICQSGKNLLDLINDLLDLAKIEAGRMEIRSEPLSLPDLFEGLANILKPLLAERRLVLYNGGGGRCPHHS